MDKETIQTLLDLLNPLHGELDRQFLDKTFHPLGAQREDEVDVLIKAGHERDLTQAISILEDRLKSRDDKIKFWWSSDRQWFCVLVDDGVSKATVSLTPSEAGDLGTEAIAVPVPALAASS